MLKKKQCKACRVPQVFSSSYIYTYMKRASSTCNHFFPTWSSCRNAHDIYTRFCSKRSFWPHIFIEKEDRKLKFSANIAWSIECQKKWLRSAYINAHRRRGAKTTLEKIYNFFIFKACSANVRQIRPHVWSENDPDWFTNAPTINGNVLIPIYFQFVCNYRKRDWKSTHVC